MSIQALEIILYVEDQPASRDFYTKLLREKPVLDVPGMTAFVLSDRCRLGLMPNKGIIKILADHTPDPASGNGIPRCELYLYVDDAEAEAIHAEAIGAKLISQVSDRDWGDKAGYFADPDGHIIAFAEKGSLAL